MATPKATPRPSRKTTPATRRRRTFIGTSRSPSSEQKAIWHHVTGAGRSRVRRRFFDANDEDKQAMAKGLETLMAARLKVPQRA